MPKPPTALPESQVTPEPALEKRTRRQFTADYKLRIIAEADACKHGELGALLRREKLYSQHPASKAVELTPRVWKEKFADKILKSDLDKVGQ